MNVHYYVQHPTTLWTFATKKVSPYYPITVMFMKKFNFIGFLSPQFILSLKSFTIYHNQYREATWMKWKKKCKINEFHVKYYLNLSQMYQVLWDIPLTKDYFCFEAITDTLLGQVSVFRYQTTITSDGRVKHDENIITFHFFSILSQFYYFMCTYEPFFLCFGWICNAFLWKTWYSFRQNYISEN